MSKEPTKNDGERPAAPPDDHTARSSPSAVSIRSSVERLMPLRFSSS